MGFMDKMKDAFGGKKDAAAEAAAQGAEAVEAAAQQQADAEAVENMKRIQAEAAMQKEEEEIAAATREAEARQAEEARLAEERRLEEERQAAEARQAEEAAAAAAAAKPGVSLRRLLEVVEHDCRPDVPSSDPLDRGLGELIENALAKALADNGLPNANKMDGFLGTSFLEAYSVWQGHLGYDGDDANGYPGKSSLTKLADATGMFHVVD